MPRPWFESGLNTNKPALSALKTELSTFSKGRIYYCEGTLCWLYLCDYTDGDPFCGEQRAAFLTPSFSEVLALSCRDFALGFEICSNSRALCDFGMKSSLVIYESCHCLLLWTSLCGKILLHESQTYGPAALGKILPLYGMKNGQTVQWSFPRPWVKTWPTPRDQWIRSRPDFCC